MAKYFAGDVLHPDSRKYAYRALAYLISGKFLGLLAPFILRSIVNSMMVPGAAVGKVAAVSSNLVYWKAGLCVMLWGGSRALSTVLV